MDQPRNKSTIDIAVSRLRTLVLEVDQGTLLGSEEDLIKQLGVSRATVRQVARLLEREGLLRVKRGINGGYFAVRPDISSIAETVSTYLEMVETGNEDVTEIASVLWIEVVRKAAALKSIEATTLAENFRTKARSFDEKTPFEEIREIEAEIRDVIFDFIKSPYTELIFQINIAYAARRFPNYREHDSSDKHRQFIRQWSHAKQLELDAIAAGDQAVAAMAARHCRNLWHQRLWGHMPN